MKSFFQGRRRVAGILGPSAAAVIAGVLVAPSPRSQTVDCDPQKAKAEISYSDHVQPLFDGYCVECHNEADAPVGLNLSVGVSYFYLVGKPSTESDLTRVNPGNPNGSYLIHKLMGTHLQVGGQGEQMPLENPPMPEERIKIIFDWIKACAPMS